METQRIRDFRRILRKFEVLVNNQLKDNSCCRGVSFAQCHVLLEIEEQGQTTTGELAQRLSQDKSTLSRTVDGLVNIGLVERRPHPSDRRFTLLTLTKQGKETCKAINRLNDDYYGKVFGRITEKKQEAIIKNFALLVQAFIEYENKKKDEMECCSSTGNKE